MFSDPAQNPHLRIGSHCQLLGVLLNLTSLFLPIAVTNRHIDEFGSKAYGFECAFAALISMVTFKASHFSLALAGLVTPAVAASLLIDRDWKLSRLVSLQPYLAALSVAGLVGSYLALAQDQYRPIYGYYLWAASILMISIPGLLRWKRSLSKPPSC